MKKLSALILGTALCAAAQAGTVSYSFDLSEETTDINQTGSLNYFDTSLGTLTGVSFKLFAHEHTSITLTNNAATTAVTRGTGLLDVTFSSSLGALNSVLGPDAQLTLMASTGNRTLAAGASATYGPYVVADETPIDVSSILASFARVGGGTFGVTCTSESGVSITGGGGNISSTQATTAGCGALITYEYTAPPTPTPEPASLALVGLGMIGVAASRRKSRKA